MTEAATEYTMRSACKKCGSKAGRMEQRGAQDCVWCRSCGAFQYNAPRTETGKKTRTVSTVHSAIKPKQRARVLARATGRCELCGKRPDTASLHVGHLVSVKDGVAGGLTDTEINDDENLCAMCDECNLGLGKQTVPLRVAVAMVMARLRIEGSK